MKLSEYVQLNRTKEKVKTEPIGFGEFYGNARALFYDLPVRDTLYKIFAFMAYPTGKKPKNGYPAVLIIHGGCGMAYIEIAKMWADRGYVAIAPDFNGCYGKSLAERGLDNPLGGPKGYGFHEILSEHPWAFFSVLSAMRAIDVLRNDPLVDGEKICSCGLSWGGFLNLSLTAVEKRIKASSVIYSSAYAGESEWGRRTLDTRSEEEQRIFAAYLDPKNYLPDITVPTFFTAGADDIAFKMVNRQKTADAISAETYFALRKSFCHGNFVGFEQPETGTFFDCILHNRKVPMPTYRLTGNRLTVKAHDRNSAVRVYVTSDDLVATEKQVWKVRPSGKGVYPIRPADRAFFVEETNPNGEVWSSKLVVL